MANLNFFQILKQGTSFKQKSSVPRDEQPASSVKHDSTEPIDFLDEAIRAKEEAIQQAKKKSVKLQLQEELSKLNLKRLEKVTISIDQHFQENS